MIRFYLLLLTISISIQQAFSTAELKYPVSEIPPLLLEGAHSVIRTKQEIFRVVALGEANVKVKKVVTILNEKGRNDGNLVIHYDKLTKINSIKGNIYDASGKLISKVKSNEIRDISAISNFSMYEDNRVKIYEIKNYSYPFTVEYEYEYQDKKLVSYPTFYPVYKEHLSVQAAELQVLLPKGFSIRYKSANALLEPEIISDDKESSYSWKFSDIPVYKQEVLGPKMYDAVPMIYTAPNEFEMAGYKGDMSSWESFGKWYFLLNNKRDELSDETVIKMKELTKNLPDDLSKIKLIYQYLQSTTRYVSIQLGIGGLQPFEASTVEKYGYGDCKALTNYTKALLNSVGISSYYTLVNAGSDAKEVLSDFPSHQFNHAFLCVPLQNDTIWLECTSQKNPFGFLGSFTSDRKVLLITEEGGKLVKTSKYTQEQNFQIRKVDINLQKDGNAIAEVSTLFSGLQYDNVDGQLHYSQEEQKKRLYKQLDIPSFEIDEFSYVTEKDIYPVIKEKLKLKVRNCGSVSGKRIFLTPNLMNKVSYTAVSKNKPRETDVYLDYNFYDVDTITYRLPEGFYAESFPESVSISTEFGQYKTTYLNEENKIIYIRELKMKKGRYPAASFEDYEKFRKEISRLDRIKLVLVNRT